MLLWFAGLSVVMVWQIFRDPAFDYRLLVAGAVLPDVIDGAAGRPWVAHTMLGSVGLLTLVMLGTRGRRALRRRLLAIPIGTFLHLLLDGMWTRQDVFWWPVLGVGFPDTSLPSVGRPLGVVVVLELVGALALLWAYRRFRLFEPERRRRFVRTGRLGRDLAAPPAP